ncbi:MAG: AAA family ATPase, partial [bacterium]|nr:AAA family ATPase [bacterium]
MRRFFSYGPIDTEIHYYASRKNLIERTFKRLMGEDSPRSGHYVTVWAPRQCGKTWIMQEVAEKIKQSGNFEVGIISMERAKDEKNEKDVLEILMEKLQIAFQRTFPPIDKIKHLPALFTKTYFKKPVILVLDEFDALDEVFIDRFASVFRDMYISRTNEKNIPAAEKTYL